MDNKQNSAYECMFIADCSVEETAKSTVKKFVGIITDNGEIIDVADWGPRRLEYPINDKNEGYYEIVTFRSAPDFPSELERLLNIDENVMRSLTIKLDEEIAEKAARRAADKATAAETAAAVAEISETVNSEGPVSEEGIAPDNATEQEAVEKSEE